MRVTEKEKDALRTIDCDKYTKLYARRDIAFMGFICVMAVYLITKG